MFYKKVIPVPVILIDSIHGKDENYHPKVFLKKHEKKKKWKHFNEKISNEEN